MGKFLRHFWGIFIDNNSYDDGKLITRLWDDYTVKPVIDIRNMWKDGEPTRLVNGMGEVLYDYCGNVYCYLEPDKKRQMAYGGFEQDRGTLKYRCPAEQYGIECENKDTCKVGKAVRIIPGSMVLRLSTWIF